MKVMKRINFFYQDKDTKHQMKETQLEFFIKVYMNKNLKAKWLRNGA